MNESKFSVQRLQAQVQAQAQAACPMSCGLETVRTYVLLSTDMRSSQSESDRESAWQTRGLYSCKDVRNLKLSIAERVLDWLAGRHFKGPLYVGRRAHLKVGSSSPLQSDRGF